MDRGAKRSRDQIADIVDWSQFPVSTTHAIGATALLSPEALGVYFLASAVAWHHRGWLPDWKPDQFARAFRVGKKGWVQARAEIKEASLWVHQDSKTTTRMVVEALADLRRRPIPTRVRRMVAERDGHRCAYCGDTSGPFHLDHVFPRSRGGSDDASNLTLACQTCNFSKGALTLEEWRERS